MKKLSLLLGVLLISAAGPIAADSLYVAASGNVGVSTGTPGEKLHILDGNLKIEQTAASVRKGGDNLRADVDVMGNQMVILEELEKAHIYLTRLNSALKDMRAEIEELNANHL